MNSCKCWAVVLIAALLLPNVAASSDAAQEAYEKGKACFDKKDYDAAITAVTEAIRLNPKFGQCVLQPGRHLL
jgi:tetratricopeptide (TPR) repeat protein